VDNNSQNTRSGNHPIPSVGTGKIAKSGSTPFYLLSLQAAI